MRVRPLPLASALLSWLTAAFVAGISLPASGEDTYLFAEAPEYDIVVGPNVTFSWTRKNNEWPQSRFTLQTSDGTRTQYTAQQLHVWTGFPFGSAWWDVEAWRDSALVPFFRVGMTSRQSFFHYNNVPNTENQRLAPFEYKVGARNLSTLPDLPVFFEITRDYVVHLKDYFASLAGLPPSYLPWDKTDARRLDLLAQIESAFDGIDEDFLSLHDGVLTIRKGYRWDGTSNPLLGEEGVKDIRSSCVHDALYDLMRMNELDPQIHFFRWTDGGSLNRLVADSMWYMITVEDMRDPSDAFNDFIVLRDLARFATDDDSKLRAWKFHASHLTAWARDRAVDLHWRPANLGLEDPKHYQEEPHSYDIWRTTAGAGSWSFRGQASITPNDFASHDANSVYFSDSGLTNGQVYYYWIRANDLDTDGDGWTDQEENDYGLGFTGNPDLHPTYNEKHYDESLVEVAVPEAGAGGALRLNGVDQLAIALGRRGRATGGAFSFEAWVRPEPSAGDRTVLALSSNAPAYPGHYTPISYDGTAQRFCYEDASVRRCNDTTSILPNRWHHVAVTIASNDQGVLYVNGLPEASFATAHRPLPTPPFAIGASFDVDTQWVDQVGGESIGNYVDQVIASDHFAGEIDEVRVWDHVRSTAAIQTGMFAPAGGDEPGLLALWHLDEPDGTHTAHEATSGGADAFLIGCSGPGACFVSSDAMQDADGDLRPDPADNCVLEPNPGQEDANAADDDDLSLAGIQHYGDACDVDLDDDGFVGPSDYFGVFRPCLGADLGARPECRLADLNGDGVVGPSDFFAGLRPALGSGPGPGWSE